MAACRFSLSPGHTQDVSRTILAGLFERTQRQSRPLDRDDAAAALEPEVSCDVAVVGAGVGGAYSAWRLIEAGAVPGSGVCLFERSDRIGGRAYSLHNVGKALTLVVPRLKKSRVEAGKALNDCWTTGPQKDFTLDVGAYRFCGKVRPPRVCDEAAMPMVAGMRPTQPNNNLLVDFLANDLGVRCGDGRAEAAHPQLRGGHADAGDCGQGRAGSDQRWLLGQGGAHGQHQVRSSRILNRRLACQSSIVSELGGIWQPRQGPALAAAARASLDQPGGGRVHAAVRQQRECGGEEGEPPT